MKVSGSLRVPGDKSISHRALIFGALERGRYARHRAFSNRPTSTRPPGVLRALGVAVPRCPRDFIMRGVGRAGLSQPSLDLDCGNSGTTTRLMAGVVAALPPSTARRSSATRA